LKILISNITPMHLRFQYFLSFILLTTFIVACNQRQDEITFYETGELYEKFLVNKEEQKHGKYERFFVNGSLAEATNYKNNQIHGSRKI
jgi:antitoxin component YwqK of YwqJK toxin-antitoxin module